jgi:hypothetical protein
MMPVQAPLPYGLAAAGEIKCAASAVDLLARHRVLLPTGHIGRQFRFGDGTSARVYRETVVAGASSIDPSVLIVKFRLRFVRGVWHAAFRWESIANTPLFVGFPGFVSKLWLAHDERDVYRGIYEWNGPDRAEHYARSLWRVLALGCEPGSIGYRVLPGLHRDDFLAKSPSLAEETGEQAESWWRPIDVH